jgi:enediyne biosynthesis protein E4
MGVPTSRLPWVAGGLVAAGVGAFLVFKLGLFNSSTANTRVVDPPPIDDVKTVPVPPVRFTDVTQKWGIDFTHHTGAFGQKLLPETMGSGVAVIDFDNDGRPDLLFVDSRPWPGYEKQGQPLPTLRFFRNLGKGKFTDVTREIGLGVSLYGMGVAVGDFDNDGFPDLFVTAVGGNRLFRNVKAPEGQGANGRMFRDVTASAGVGGPGGWPKLNKPGEFLKHGRPICWSTSAAFLDYDGDGKLDLFVCNYVTWSPTLDLAQHFTLTGKGRSYGPPTSFDGAQCFLYRNLGGGRFEDVSAKAGVQVFQRGGTDTDKSKLNVGKSLGVIVADVDDDGWPDVIVANDTVRNFLFRNVADPKAPGGRSFKEIGQEAGVAYAEGNARGAMGADWAPHYRPGKSALLIGNFADEPDTFLCLDDPRDLLFADVSLAEGISGPSRSPLKFGVFFFDYDLDGRLDFLTCNGHLDPEIGQVQLSQSYAQRPQLFWNTGTRFEEVTARDAGPDLFKPLVGRGCAYADLDGDGKLDVILTANGGPARVLRNEGGAGNHWLRLKLVGDGKRSNTSAIGAQVTLEAGGQVQQREVCSARGYMSQSELVLTFGLGKETKVDRVTIRWPGKDAGPPQVRTGLAVDKEYRIEQKPAK